MKNTIKNLFVTLLVVLIICSCNTNNSQTPIDDTKIVVDTTAVNTINFESLEDKYSMRNNVRDTLTIPMKVVHSLNEYISVSEEQKIKHTKGLNTALKQYTNDEFDINKTNFFKIYNSTRYSIDHIFMLAHMQFNYEMGNSPFDIEYIINDNAMLKKYFDYIDNNFQKFVSYYQVTHTSNNIPMEHYGLFETYVKRFWEIYNNIYLTTITECKPLLIDWQLMFKNDCPIGAIDNRQSPAEEFFGDEHVNEVLLYYRNFYFY